MILKNKIRASQKLYLLVFILSLFIIGIGFYGINEMRKMNRQMQTLYADRMIPLEQLNNIRYAYLDGIIASAEQIHAKQFSNAIALEQIETSQKNIKVNWEAYLKTYLTPEETIIAHQTQVLMKQSDKIVEQLKLALQQENEAALNNLIKNKLYITINPLIAQLDALVSIQIKVGQKLYENNNEVYESANKKFLFLIALSLGFALPFSYYLIRNVNGLIKNLRLKNVEITQSEEKYHSILEHAGDAIFIIAEDNAIIDVNHCACELLGYSEEELLRKKTSELNASDQYTAIEDQWNQLRQNTVLMDERFLLKKDGTMVEVEISRKILADGKSYIAIVRDITERKRAKEQLKTYKHFFYNSNDLASISNTDGYLEIVNPQFAKILGYTEEELKKNKVFHFIHPEDIEATTQEIEKLKLGIDTINFVNRYRKADGKYLWFESNATVDSNNGKLYSITRDITERKKTEDLLRESEIRFSKAFKSAPVSIIVSRISDGTLFEVNEATEKLLNYTREELIGKSTTELNIWVNENDRDFLVNELAEKGQLHGHDFRFRAKGGKTVIVNSSTELIELGGEQCFLCVLVDITERKEIEESLKISEKKYRNIFENVQDVFYQANLDGKILEVSPSVETYIGYKRDELIGSLTENFYWDPDDREKIYQVLQEHLKIMDYEFLLKSKTGEPIYVSLNARLITGDENTETHVDGVLRNITEKKKIELEREKMVSDILHRNKKSEEFSFIVSHNLRAPVAAIIGITKMLNSNPTEAERIELEQSLVTSAEKLDQIIRVLNEVLQIRTQITESKEDVVFSELISQIKSGIFHLIPCENTQIITDFTATDTIFSLRSFIKSIFYNLISNSIKFKQTDKDIIIWIKTSVEDEKVHIHFKDNGRGLDLDKFGKKIFNLYERFHLDIESNGIGLFMVKNQVEILGGTISVESQPGIGTEFIIELPI